MKVLTFIFITLLCDICPSTCLSCHIFQFPMTLGIFGGVIIHISFRSDSNVFQVCNLGMANIAVDGLLYLPSCLLLGTSLIVRVYIYSFGNVGIRLRLLVGRMAVCLLSSSICLGYMSSGLVSCCRRFLSACMASYLPCS